MHSDVRNANVIRDSLQAIEQLSRLARISLDLQSTHTFRHACQELMSFLYEPIYPQEVVQSSIMSCLQVRSEIYYYDNTLPLLTVNCSAVDHRQRNYRSA